MCMKKVFVLLLPLLFVACDKAEEPERPSFSHPVETEENTVIDKLYEISMRREIPFPFAAYVLRLADGNDVYMLRYRYNRDLHEGERISYRVFSFCPDEIAVLNGVELGDGSDAGGEKEKMASRGLVATDPTEAYVTDIFDMKIRYSLTFVPIDTWFIELDDGKLVYVKKSKLNLELKPGDHIVYNVYTLSPNEVLAIKKLD